MLPRICNVLMFLAVLITEQEQLPFVLQLLVLQL